MTEADLLRFVDAQAPVYSQVIEELTAGCKRTHWMWFIFPQLRGLGHSAMAQRYAIRDLDQATRYLADNILGTRLRHDVQLMIKHTGQIGVGDSRFSRQSKVSILPNSLWSSGRRQLGPHVIRGSAESILWG